MNVLHECGMKFNAVMNGDRPGFFVIRCNVDKDTGEFDEFR